MKSFLAGMGVGFGVGLLLAPSAGSETRKKAMERLSTATDQVRETSQPIVSAVRDHVEQLSDLTPKDVQQDSSGETEIDRLLEVLNSASKTKLMSVSGIGDATARRIIDSRPYDSADGVVGNGIMSEEVMRNLKKELLNKEEGAA